MTATFSRDGAVKMPAPSRPGLFSLNNLILIFFLLLPLEGVLRKWVLPGLEGPLGFIRDPVLLMIYAAYLTRLRRAPAWLKLYLVFGGALAAFAFIFGIVSSINPIVTLLGLRSYVLYVPLAFIMADVWTREDFRRFLIIALWLSLPIALLVFIQYSSPVASWINKGTSDAVQGRFTVIFGIVRPYGPFTFAQAQNTFAALMTALWFIAWEKRFAFRLSLYLVVLSGLATLTMGALSGGRTYFGSAALIAATYVLAGLTAKNPRQGLVRLARLGLASAVFFVVFTVVFPRSFEAMSARQAEASRIEGGTLERAFGLFTAIIEPMRTAPIWGHGLGVGSNAAARLTGNIGLSYGESEWVRIINECGPVVGLLVILARVGFTIWLGWLCIQINRRTGDGAPLILFGFTGYLTLIAQVTLQSQLLTFCWFAVGLTLVLCRQAILQSRQARLR